MSSPDSTQTQAIVCRPPVDGKRRWCFEKVAVGHPAEDEVIVEMIATGVCHTDLICGSSPDEDVSLGLPTYPRVLGHEGAVGLAAVMGAKIGGCRTIIVVDRVVSRLELAKSLGATHVINTNDLTKSLTDEVRKLTAGTGSNITVDATGVVSLIQHAVEFTANQGKMILLGVAPMDAGLEIAIVRYMFTGKSILGSMEGGVYPEEYVPQMLRWYEKGLFPVNKLVKF